MRDNTGTVREYLEGFCRSHHARVLSCLTDDIEWEMPGIFHIRGKEAFDGEIENEAFVGSPQITVDHMAEENDVVVAEGTVQAGKEEASS